MGEALAIIAAAAGLLGAALVSYRVFRRIVFAEDAMRTSLELAAQSLTAKRENDDITSERSRLMIPDYIDQEMFVEVAGQLGIDTEPYQVQSGRSVSTRTGVQSSIKGELGPPIGKVTSEIGEREEEERSALAAVTIQRRPNFRALMEEVLAAAEEKGQLIRDLDEIPKNCLPEAAFLQSARALRSEWSLEPTAARAAFEGQRDEESEGEPAGEETDSGEAFSEDEADQAVEMIEGHLFEVEATAMKVINGEAGDRIQSVAKEGNQLTVVDNWWRVLRSDTDLSLVLVRLRTPDLLTEDAASDVPASGFIKCPISSEHLLAHGRRRFRSEDSFRATVFGRTEDLDEAGWLTVYPIAVYSVDQ